MEIIEQVYYNPENPASFSGVTKLAEELKGKVSKSEVEEWLQKQDSHTLHKPVRLRFPTRHYNLNNIYQLYECDLTDYLSLKSYNDGYCYLLCVIDCVSKYVNVIPLKNKKPESVIEGFDKIFNNNDEILPITIQSDRGKEFTATSILKYFKEKGIKHRASRNPTSKAAIIERFQRTLKTKIQKYMTYKNTKRYIDILPLIVKSYNNTRHSVTLLPPSSVTLDNAHVAVENIKKRYRERREKRVKYKIGQQVRISRARETFDKSYLAGFSEEILLIKRISKTRTPHVYILSDLNNQEIDGVFYEFELSPVKKDLQSEEFIIDKILSRKGKGKNKQVLVSWRGYPSQFNSWIPETNIKNVE